MNDEALPTIAILGGTGNEGPGLALRWARVGYPIVIGSRKLEKARDTAARLNEELGIESICGLENADAAKEAEICVLTVVATAHQAALKSLKDALQGKILVDATARVDFRDPTPPSPPSAARIAQEILGPDVRVVAAFQNVPAHALKQDLDQPVQTDVLVLSDDAEAADRVVQLAQDGGMRAYYAGGLDDAIVAEGLTAILINLNKIHNVRTASIGVRGID